jgi:hypothetical protein
MKVIKKIEKLPLNQKLIILWSTTIIIGIVFSFWRINNFKSTFQNFTKEDWGVTPKEETIDEIKKSSEIIRESTTAIKEGFGAIKDLSEDIKEFKDLNEGYQTSSTEEKVD